MKNHFITLLLIILLSSCATPSGQGGIDPGVSGYQAQLTADAAQWQANLYNLVASVTAQAPITGITQTAAALNFAQTEVSMRDTQIAALWTPTPSPIPTATPSPTLDIPATQTAIQLAAFATKTTQDLQARETNNKLRGMIGTFLFVLLVLIIAYGLITFSRERRHKPMQRDEAGRAPVILDHVTGRAVDHNANPNYFDFDESLIRQLFIHWLVKSFGFESNMPKITAARQDTVKERDQAIQYVSVSRSRKQLIDPGSMKFLPEPDEEAAPDMTDSEILLPEFNVIYGWDGQSRPLGLGRKGIIKAQAASPHLLATGGTGSGKTAFMLRTQAAVSLAKGYQVINLGFSNSGFGVFESHPNFYSIRLNESADVIDCLASVYKELKERKEIIGGAAIEWEHWTPGQLPPRPFVDVLVDELGNMADDIYTSEESTKDGASRTRQLWRWMSMIAKEGRKVGIRFLAALQDPTAKSVDLSFRRNCTLVSFQLGDAHQSRSFIGVAGAELLQVGHFMTRNFTGNEGVIIGGGFAPSDEEIRDYLSRAQITKTPPPNWIEGTIKSQTALPMPPPVQISAPKATPQGRVDFINGLRFEWQVKALDLYEAGITDTDDLITAVLDAEWDHGIATAAINDLISRWRAAKGIIEPPAPAAAPVIIETPAQPAQAKADAKQSQIIELAESIRDRWNSGLSKSAVSRLLGKEFAGSSWVATVNAVIDYLASTPTPAGNGAESGISANLGPILG